MYIVNKIIACCCAIKDFFVKPSKATRSQIGAFDAVEIIVALMPLVIFGCLVFELSALCVLAISLFLNVALDFLWNIIFKKPKIFNLQSVIFGLLAGLTLSSRLNIWLVVLANVLAFALSKTVFKESKINFIAPWLFSRAIFAGVFFSAFSVYAVPFVHTLESWLPLDSNYISYSFVHTAKYLFFGIHSGNIGEVSELLLGLGGIYLIFRKIINPIIPITFIITTTVLSVAFGEILSLSLLGGGLFMAAFFLTLDYSLVTMPLYKKILYGITCGILTFVIRRLLRTEGAYFAVIIADLLFLTITRKNVNKFIKFVKSPNFGKLFKKVKNKLSV